MARTRAQDKLTNGGGNAGPEATQTRELKQTPKKRSKPGDAANDQEDTGRKLKGAAPKRSSNARPAKSAKHGADVAATISHPKLSKLLANHGTFPLQSLEESGLAEPFKPMPSTILAHVLHALLTSTRISHKLALKTLHIMVENGYADSRD